MTRGQQYHTPKRGTPFSLAIPLEVLNHIVDLTQGSRDWCDFDQAIKQRISSKRGKYLNISQQARANAAG
jgi:hypothetical protein